MRKLPKAVEKFFALADAECKRQKGKKNLGVIDQQILAGMSVGDQRSVRKFFAGGI